MRTSTLVGTATLAAGMMLLAPFATAQTAPDLAVMRGLAPVSTLQNTVAGKAALAANFATTGAIQGGSAHQPMLLSFAAQQQQALRDAFITGANASELADGLGTTLGGVYQASASYTSADDGKTTSPTSISPAIARLIADASAAERADSRAAKFYFANATIDGKAPASAAALAVLTAIGGTTDVFGKSYGLPAGSAGADRYGNSRPFQTEPHFLAFEGKDFFGVSSGNLAYLRGPAQDLTDSPSYPSGHTTYGYTESLVLAILVPERYPQMVVRAAEYGNDRIVLGAHYAMDVLGGRTLAEYDLARFLMSQLGNAKKEGQGAAAGDSNPMLAQARADLQKALASGCGDTVAACARRDDGRFADAARDEAFYESTQTYGLPVVFAHRAAGTEDVGKLAPEAGYLLTAAFPDLTLTQADAILTSTEGPGGNFLDDGSAFGVYSRLDLYRAAREAIAEAAADARR
jgi:hypothetical protein